MNHKKRIAAVVVIYAFMVLTGCSADAENTSQADPSDAEITVSESTAQSNESGNTVVAAVIEPEQLISKEEAAVLLGEAVLDGEKTENAVVGQKICFYDATDEASDQFLQIGIIQQAFMPEDSTNTPESIYKTTRDYGDGSQVVTGIGDEAILAGGGYYILSGDYVIIVCAGNTDDPAVLAVLDEAGALAINNLNAILGQ